MRGQVSPLSHASRIMLQLLVLMQGLSLGAPHKEVDTYATRAWSLIGWRMSVIASAVALATCRANRVGVMIPLATVLAC